MYVHFGKKPFGKCDVVPELFHVATVFFHINFVPLIPLESYVIFNENAKQFRGTKIPLSVKSIFYAWARTGTFFGAVALSIYAIVELTDDRVGANAQDWMEPGVFAAA